MLLRSCFFSQVPCLLDVYDGQFGLYLLTFACLFVLKIHFSKLGVYLSPDCTTLLLMATAKNTHIIINLNHTLNESKSDSFTIY